MTKKTALTRILAIIIMMLCAVANIWCAYLLPAKPSASPPVSRPSDTDSLPAISSKANFIHLSFDDVSASFSNLATNTYTSLWDEPFFEWLKNLNSQYGAKISLYTYNDVLKNIDNQYVQDFAAASSWLKIGFHSDTQGHSLANAGYDTAKQYWTEFVNHIIRVTGSPVFIDRMPRLEFFAGSLDALLGMRDAPYGALGFLSADDSRYSYYFDSYITNCLYTNDYIKDKTNNLVFVSTDIRGDWFFDFSTQNNYRQPSKTNMFDELVFREQSDGFNRAWKSVIVFTHEWMIYTNGTINQKATCITDVCIYANQYNISFGFLQDQIFEDTDYDCLFGDIND